VSERMEKKTMHDMHRFHEEESADWMCP